MKPKIRVLVADDSPFICRLLTHYLESDPEIKVIETAHNGKEALKIYKDQTPDLIISDILMPEMEGLETIQKIKTENPAMPIIAITGSTDSPYLQLALKLGAAKGLYKPFNQTDLLDAVRSALPDE